MTAQYAAAGVWRMTLQASVVLLLMLGLLGMHTLSVHHELAGVSAGVGAEGPHDTAHSTGNGLHSAHSAGHAAAASNLDAPPSCLDCTTAPDHGQHAAMLACILLLLVSILWAARRRPGTLSRYLPRLSPLVAAPPRTAPVRTPSLIELSISRT